MKEFKRSSPLYIARPIVPDQQIFSKLWEQMNDLRIYSNFGEIERTFRTTLLERWNCTDLLLVNNATIGLLVGLLALPKKGVLLTTPFSFPATAHAAKVAGFDVRFCDINPKTLNLDPSAVLDAIDDNTVGILGVHVFGNPCHVEEFRDICNYHGLYEIYDAAHCTDVLLDGHSLFDYGLFSVVSFHATKLLHTGEGGAIISKNAKFMSSSRLRMNFGILKEDVLDGFGLNAKMSEINAAVGLSVLPQLSEEIASRKIISHKYHEVLDKIVGVSFPIFPENIVQNYQYFPVLLQDNTSYKRDLVQLKLKENNIHCRKYFYPLLNQSSSYSSMEHQPLPVAERVANQILCLPVHSGVTDDDILCICDHIKSVIGMR